MITKIVLFAAGKLEPVPVHDTFSTVRNEPAPQSSKLFRNLQDMCALRTTACHSLNYSVHYTVFTSTSHNAIKWRERHTIAWCALRARLGAHGNTRCCHEETSGRITGGTWAWLAL